MRTNRFPFSDNFERQEQRKNVSQCYFSQLISSNFIDNKDAKMRMKWLWGKTVMLDGNILCIEDKKKLAERSQLYIYLN